MMTKNVVRKLLTSRYLAFQATFAEIPGVLETGTIRKIDRRYPFNDACQWFIDHADLIILVYDYAKLDIGPETEALLDQLKGRESQVSSYFPTFFSTLCIVFVLQYSRSKLFPRFSSGRWIIVMKESVASSI